MRVPDLLDRILSEVLVIRYLVLVVFSFGVWGSSLADGQQMASIGRLILSSGKALEDCRVGYRTYGQMNADRSNIIVMPTWFTGTTADLERYLLVGPGRLADSDRYYVITVDALGNGVSSSPSNSEITKDNFPTVSIEDMVESQHRLLTEVLDVPHVNTVMGVSMGGMQTFQWLGAYPEFMDHAVPIDGSPKMTSYDLLQWQSHRSIIRTLQNAGSSNGDIMELLSVINQLTLWTPAYFVENVSPEALPEFLRSSGEGYSSFDADDYVLQLDAMIGQDVAGPTEADRLRYIESVVAKVLIIGVPGDHMVNPEPGKMMAALIAADYFEIDSNCGHMGSTCEADRVARRVHQFLSSDSH